MLFQSAPPARGATHTSAGRVHRYMVSIRAPRAGGDLVGLCRRRISSRFQSAPPARGATVWIARRPGRMTSFNPRPPRGGRPSIVGEDRSIYEFQSEG